MSIKKISNYNNRLGLSAISGSEVSYILNSYIEESFNDLQIKCLMVDNRSLQESGVRYFTEENEAVANIKEKFEKIARTVWATIISIFDKIKDFIKNMILDFQTRKLGDKYKDAINKIPDNEFKNIVNEDITIVYDIEKFKNIVISNTDKDFNKSRKDIIQDIIDINRGRITKEEMIDFVSGGMKKANREIQSIFSEIRSEYNKEYKNFGNVGFDLGWDDDEGVLKTAKSYKEALQHLSKMSGVYNTITVNKYNEMRTAAKHILQFVEKKNNKDINVSKMRKDTSDAEEMVNNNKKENDHLQDIKNGAAKNVSDRHKKAGEEIKKTLKNIHKNLNDSSEKAKNDKDNDDIDNMFDDLEKW